MEKVEFKGIPLNTFCGVLGLNVAYVKAILTDGDESEFPDGGIELDFSDVLKVYKHSEKITDKALEHLILSMVSMPDEVEMIGRLYERIASAEDKILAEIRSSGVGTSSTEITKRPKKKSDYIVYDHKGNQYLSTVDMCKHYGIRADTYSLRVKKGWSVEKSLTTPVQERKRRAVVKEVESTMVSNVLKDRPLELSTPLPDPSLSRENAKNYIYAFDNEAREWHDDMAIKIKSASEKSGEKPSDIFHGLYKKMAKIYGIVIEQLWKELKDKYPSANKPSSFIIVSCFPKEREIFGNLLNDNYDV